MDVSHVYHQGFTMETGSVIRFVIREILEIWLQEFASLAVQLVQYATPLLLHALPVLYSSTYREPRACLLAQTANLEILLIRPVKLVI